jgi:hypothetical protein
MDCPGILSRYAIASHRNCPKTAFYNPKGRSTSRRSDGDGDVKQSCVVPRPIGWISTRSAGEEPIDNLAPYSQFNNLSFSPPYVMFAANQGTFDGLRLGAGRPGE